MLKSTTGLKADGFQAVFEFLRPVLVVRISNFMMVKITSSLKLIPQNLKLGRKTKILAISQFFIYLSCLRNEFTTRINSWLFDIPRSTLSRYLVTWDNLLYFSLGKIVIWPSKVQVLHIMAETFTPIYPSTRCIIGWKKISC